MSGVNMSKIKKLYQEKKYTEIVLEIEKLTTEKNRSSILHNLLGVCYASRKDRTEDDVKNALGNFEKAFYKDNLGELSLESLCNHIKLCAEMGRKENTLISNLIISEKMYIEAEKKFSNNQKYLSHGIDLYKYLLKHKKRILIIEKILKLKKLDKLVGSLYITSQMYLSDWKQKNFSEFQKKFTNLFNNFDAKKIINLEPDKKKIKVGFLSPDFYKSHSTSYFIINLIKDLKKTKFETVALSLLKMNQHDETSEKLKELFDHWIDLGDTSDQETVNKIQSSNIDILIDLVGLWSANRANIFNTRICPLQINWLGFNNESGFKEIDFVLADINTTQDEEKDYGTKIYKLPKIWNSHCGFKHKRIYNELPFKRNGYLTFGSLNNFMKINDEVLNTWIKILKKVKKSKIILKSSLFICEDVLRKKFTREGLIDRVEILKKTNKNDFLSHINVYNQIDLCLDTFPFNGVTTTFEALWKNVPVITKTGYNFNSRCGESILKNANIDKFIAISNEDYIEKAVFYSNNIYELENTREQLFDEILETPLFDTKGFSKNFCDALDQMYKQVIKNYK
tara:strand:- start:1302 stop:3002 length:1701 start_codon:yes stop_codon:yes gene_type:complete